MSNEHPSFKNLAEAKKELLKQYTESHGEGYAEYAGFMWDAFMQGQAVRNESNMTTDEITQAKASSERKTIDFMKRELVRNKRIIKDRHMINDLGTREETKIKSWIFLSETNTVYLPNKNNHLVRIDFDTDIVDIVNTMATVAHEHFPESTMKKRALKAKDISLRAAQYQMLFKAAQEVISEEDNR